MRTNRTLKLILVDMCIFIFVRGVLILFIATVKFHLREVLEVSSWMTVWHEKNHAPRSQLSQRPPLYVEAFGRGQLFRDHPCKDVPLQCSNVGDARHAKEVCPLLTQISTEELTLP